MCLQSITCIVRVCGIAEFPLNEEINFTEGISFLYIHGVSQWITMKTKKTQNQINEIIFDSLENFIGFEASDNTKNNSIMNIGMLSCT